MTAPAAPAGFAPLHSGKVRDLYVDERPGTAGALLLVASDRVSAYDYVLTPEIPGKGRLLTALSRWWFDRLADLVPHHVLATDAPEVPEPLVGRAMLCRHLEMVPVECVARAYLTGSGLAEYRRTGAVCGVALPPGLEEGSRLPEPIFTPTTKAPVGEHDEPLTYADVVDVVGAETAAQLRDLTVAVLARGNAVAEGRGILLADTKVEFGRDPDTGRLTLADEVLTPDSSRFWPAAEWVPGRPQPSYDKQRLRDWLVSPESGWRRESGEPPPPLPPEVVAATRAGYVEAYERLTGQSWAD